MDLSFLPNAIFKALNKCNLNNVCEIRLRMEYPVLIRINNKNFYISQDGITLFKSLAIYCTKEDIELIMQNITERSLYAFNEQIKKGFITTKEDIRIGLCGECVVEGGQVDTIKNVSSLNIRLPHSVLGCADNIYNKIINSSGFYNTLVVSPPGIGKTTLLKDICRKINQENKNASIMIIDERREFTSCRGENVDIIVNSDKLYAFNYGIRSMSPDVVITDELSSNQDWQCCKNASDSGINVFASCHGLNIDDVKSKQYYIENVFDRFILFDKTKGVGVIKGVYDIEGKLK